MFGCSSEATASVSRRKRSRKAASWFGGRGVSGSSTFTATWRRGRDCRAKYTAPIPPCPITCWSLHVPSMVPINASGFIRYLTSFLRCESFWLPTSRVCLLPIPSACGARLFYSVVWTLRFAHFPHNNTPLFAGEAALACFILLRGEAARVPGERGPRL